MASASASGTTLLTSSRVRSTFAQVSFFAPGSLRPLRETQMRHVGGSEPTPVKKENGARFAVPSWLSVETQAMGRGRIVAAIHW